MDKDEKPSFARIDVIEATGAVRREVRTVERDGRPARVVVATRIYPTDVADAWDALTSAERIPRWFMPIEGELRLGGRYQLKGNAGGTITACNPPSHLSVTWEFGGGVSFVDVRLEAIGKERTRLTLEHAAFVDDIEPFWNQYGPGATGVGWDLALLGLGMHLEGAPPVDPQEAAAWSVSDEGKRYTQIASDDWGRASIEAGTDPDEARAAAQRTTAFYTGAA